MPTDSPVTLDMVSICCLCFFEGEFSNARAAARSDCCVFVLALWRRGSVSLGERCDRGPLPAPRRRCAHLLERGANIIAEATRCGDAKAAEFGRAAMSNAPEMQMRTLTRCINLIATQLRTPIARDLDGCEDFG